MASKNRVIMVLAIVALAAVVLGTKILVLIQDRVDASERHCDLASATFYVRWRQPVDMPCDLLSATAALWLELQHEHMR